MTPHEINNVIARAWIQHQKKCYDPFNTNEFREQVKRIKARVLEQINQDFYEKNKDLIEFLKEKPVSKQYVYIIGETPYSGPYPLRDYHMTYCSAFNNFVTKDKEYIEITKSYQVKADKLTTDRGYFYVVAMLLYREGMQNEELYNAIKDYFTA